MKPGGAAAGWVGSFIAATVAYLLIVLLPGLTMPREISRRFDTVLCRMSAVVKAMETVVGAERL
ncbi:hypothetical protein C3469_09835 [Mycobacterium kansasii]|nr:hypothetical protein C3B43_27150 [Mycobacterium kansasii]POY00577.1 hypothetical protein C3477_20575 [Mycobacterium kansasii]POY01645.1 hypothetical protein C3479_11730 [Mycobacterium kansasii]POY17391.1 hypothetical protein C3476_20920 [Mycobacterium kansasii]POY27754.1 hypothetical protein C3469_09835 [Mycobacterium kansasii]